MFSKNAIEIYPKHSIINELRKKAAAEIFLDSENFDLVSPDAFMQWSSWA